MDVSIEQKLKVTGIRELTATTYVVRMERNGMKFRAGQNLNLGLDGSPEKRDYSIYSGENDDYLEILVREVDDGLVSKQLHRLKPGDCLQVDGPFGFFTPKPEELNKTRFVFIATGTGISPFHSIVRSHPDIDYLLIHGIRLAEEQYDKDQYQDGHYVPCITSEEVPGAFLGRVTDYIRQNPQGNDKKYFLCGNVNMIYDVFDILKEQGVPSENLHAEVYF
ncbi:MAG: ferredoxin--NADP reductase [Bacteroidales bacterium]